MKNLSYLKYILILISLVLIFINWKIGVITFFVFYFYFYVFVYGPNYTLSFLSGLSVVSSVIFIFINWKVSVSLFVISYILIKFRLYGNKVNNKYYSYKERDIIEELMKEYNMTREEISEATQSRAFIHWKPKDGDKSQSSDDRLKATLSLQIENYLNRSK